MSADRSLAPASDAPAVPLTGFYAFVVERIRRGAMVPTAIARANTTLRSVNKAQARHFGRLAVDPPSQQVARRGEYRIERIALAQANAYVTQFHRHLNGVVGHLASRALYDDAALRGVIVLGRPVARHQDDGATVEVLRVCTDGSRNACSKLYGAARRYAKANRMTRVITYTLPDEPGASLKASGFICTGSTDGGSWARPTRDRADKAPTCAKLRWEMAVPAAATKPAAGRRKTMA